MTDELKHLLALWENAVCEIRRENKACENNAWINNICDKLEKQHDCLCKRRCRICPFCDIMGGID